MVHLHGLTSSLFILTIQTVLVAGNVTTVTTEPPVCGLQCISLSISRSECAPTNTTCICTNAALEAEIESCISADCTIREQLETQRYSHQICGIEGEDRTALVWIIGLVFGTIGLAVFLLRRVARIYGSQWGADDWVMCLVQLFMISMAILSVPLANHGLGLDIWNVAFDDITSILLIYYIDEVLYASALAFTKVSILLFYLKVFPKRSFRYSVYVLIGLNVAYALAYDLVLIFQCNPIDGAWRSWDGTYNAKCMSINLIGWSAAAINIALDLATIVLPLPELFRLSMSLKKKIQIMLMFVVGFFVTIVSAIRLKSLIGFGTTHNITQDYVEAGYWSTIEVPVGVVCACMPAIRSLFSLALPKVFWFNE